MDTSLLFLVFYLLGYCLLHSFLASLTCKRWFAGRFPEGMKYYRLAFNGLAVVLLLPVAFVLLPNSSPPLWQWHGLSSWLMNGLALAAVVAFVHSLGDYDLSQFSGSAQLQSAEADPEQHARFRLGWWHRCVRHPWYFFALVLLWTREMNTAQLLVYTLFSVYFVVGSRLEERKLVAQFGGAYRTYCRLIPGLIPNPWNQLSCEQAQELEQQANAYAKKASEQ